MARLDAAARQLAVPVRLIDDMVEGALASVPRIPLWKGVAEVATSRQPPRISSVIIGVIPAFRDGSRSQRGQVDIT